MKNAAFCCNDELFSFIFLTELEKSCRTANLIGYLNDRSFAFWMHKYLCLRMLGLQL